MPITLKGQPKSTNHIYKYACRGSFPSMYMTGAGRDQKESYQWQAKAQWRGPVLECPLAIEVALFFATKAKHDIDNYGKLLLDALTGIVWADDSQIVKMTVTKTYDNPDPRIEVSVAPCLPTASPLG